jgi:NADPH:quinone reductase
MATDVPEHSLELRSLVSSEGTLELSLQEVPMPDPRPNEVLVRVDAAPVNPSDLGLLLAGADPATATFGGSADRPVVTLPLEARAMRALSGRVGKSMTVGNEGAGVVVSAGAATEAQALVGRSVAIAGGAMYAQYRCVPASQCLVLPEGTTPKEGASSFVNPMTALGMVGTMRREGHGALVHTAAASNLGQMLVKLCIEEQVPLVNVVRKPEQVDLLTSIGAVHVCDSSAASFMADLISAISDTGATLAFDAVGGGSLAGQILTCMEVAASASAKDYSRYGSTTHKQVYIYGGLDTSPTVLTRSFGFAWGLGGWLVSSFLQSVGPEEAGALRQRVVTELSTTFKSTYTQEVTLIEMLQPASLAAYSKRATGEKYLVVPTRG